jgi:glucose/arabinose dehydrogenase
MVQVVKFFAKGLRNSVGIEFSPYSGELWGVNNGRDMLDDHHPEEELNIIHSGKTLWLALLL